MSKHTPGFTSVDIFGANTTDGLLAANCRLRGHGFVSLSQAERLIAEAPAMLEILRRFNALANEGFMLRDYDGASTSRDPSDDVADLLSRIDAM